MWYTIQEIYEALKRWCKKFLTYLLKVILDVAVLILMGNLFQQFIAVNRKEELPAPLTLIFSKDINLSLVEYLWRRKLTFSFMYKGDKSFEILYMWPNFNCSILYSRGNIPTNSKSSLLKCVLGGTARINLKTLFWAD